MRSGAHSHLADCLFAMSKNLSPLRPAMTAIAAVIALSSTPLFAQTTDSAAPTAAPVVVAPPPVITAPPAATQTAAPEISTPAPAAAPAPAPAMKTVGTPVVHESDSAATDTASTRVAPAPVKRVATATNRTANVRASAPPPTASATPAKADKAPASLSGPAAKTMPTATETAAAAPAATPSPVATTTKTTHASTVDEDALPIAGGVGAAVILLGGAAVYAMRRRRREDDEELVVPASAPVETVAVREADPVMVAPKAAPATIAATGMPKALPNGFDISRFGRHTQAAYLGPTPDNPSHSLKRRLKRASFFDQREREAAEAGHRVAQTPIEAPVQQAARAAHDDGQVTVRLAPQRKSGGFGYIFQR